MTDEIKKKRGRPAGTKNKPKGDQPKDQPKARAAAAGKTTEHDRPAVEEMTDEQEQVLFGQHLRAYDQALEKKKLADADFKNVCKKAKADLGASGIDQIKLKHALETDTGKRMLKERMAWQIKIARWDGMPVGHINDLFSEDRQPIEDKMFADGKRAGLNGESCNPPKTTTGQLQQKWVEGWHAGQEVVAEGFTQKPDPEVFGAKPALPAPAKDPEAPPAPDWHAQGLRAFENGEPGTPPDAVPEEHRPTWREGWGSGRVTEARQRNDRAAAH